MATSRDKLLKYSQMEHLMPQDAQGIGCVEDKDGRFVMLGFKTKREILTEVGYLSSDPECMILHACMNVVCARLTGEAVMKAGLSQREAVAAALSDDGILSEEDRPYALMAELAVRYALQHYADTRKGITL